MKFVIFKICKIIFSPVIFFSDITVSIVIIRQRLHEVVGTRHGVNRVQPQGMIIVLICCGGAVAVIYVLGRAG